MSESSSQSKLQVGGALDFRKHLYITRQAVEDELFGLLEEGEYCNILTSRQVGKTTVMMKTAARLIDMQRRVAIIDIAGKLGGEEDATGWYIGLLESITEECDIPIDITQWWADQGGATANQRFIRFFRDIILTDDEPPLVVFIDEIDSTLRLPYTDDFFTAIRAMYNERARQPAFTRVAFCLVGVATPNELIKARRITSYNIGHNIDLSDFDIERDNVRPLLQAIAAEPSAAKVLLRRVFFWTDGHPFLTLRLCDAIVKQNITSPEAVDRLSGDMFANLERVHHDPHFEYIVHFLDERVHEKLATYRVYEQLLRGETVRDRAITSHIQLKLAGLVKRDPQGNLKIRNRIYETIFNLAWVREIKPRQTLRNLRRIVAATSVLLFLALSSLIYDHIVLKPRRIVEQTAKERLIALDNTSNETDALKFFSILTGQQQDPELKRYLNNFEVDALQAYKRFWDRRAKALEVRALQRIQDGDIDEGLIWGAASAVKQNGAVHPRILEAYDARHYDMLRVTFRTLPHYQAKAAFSPDSKRVAMGVRRNEDVDIWDVASGKVLLRLSGHNSRVDAVAYSSDGLLLVSGGFDSKARIWDALTGEAILLLAGHNDPLKSVTFSPDNKRVATASLDRTGRIWNVESGQELLRFTHEEALTSIAYSPDGRCIATGSDDKTARIWDALTGEELLRLVGHESFVKGVAFSPNGKQVATASWDATARIWDAESGMQLHQLRHDGLLGSIAYSPDGRHIVTGSRNGSAWIWEAATGNELFKINAHTGTLEFATLSPDGKSLLTMSVDDNTRIWDITQIGKPRRQPRETPRELWQSWQIKLNLTVNDDDEVIALWPIGPRELNGWDERLV